MAGDDRTMPLTGHLEELRWRLISSLLAIGVAFLPCYFFANFLFDFLTLPLREVATDPLDLIGTGVIEAFFTKLKVSFMAAIFITTPVVLYQVWQFVAPGLYAHEKRYVWPFIFFCSLFFLLGSGFCYTVVLPVGYAFFLEEYKSIGVHPALRISEYLTFTSRMLLAFGVTFELPVLAFFFARVGLITHRTLLGFSRYAMIIIFLLAAVLTPADVASQMLLAGPLMLLYGVSIGIAYLFGKKATRSEDTETEEDQEKSVS